MSLHKVRYLVRRLIVINSEGNEKLFPLAVISACKEESLLYNIEIEGFKVETAGTLYFDNMTLRVAGDGKYEILNSF